ncbi:MAG: hypothetical protein MEQ74_11525, partial [Paracoccus sp.]|nr:hypothetical protein [Paracoccus sp. (in: a-proteobacteria)]
YQADMQVSRSYDDRTARISLQISINVKKQENQNHDHDVNSTPQPSPNPQNVPRSNRASQHRLPGPSSVPAFGEAVFRPSRRRTQAGFVKKTCQPVKFLTMH